MMIKDLGWANGWKEDPEEVKEAEALGYRLVAERLGNCVTRYTCVELGFSFKVDSSY